MNLPPNQGLRCIPDIVADAVCDPDVYRSVVNQFGVETKLHQRYRALFNDDGTLKATWCNIFLWDVSVAFRCEIPHWVLKGTCDDKGRPRWEACDQLLADPLWGPAAADRVELSANDTVKWLSTSGISRYGWKLVTQRGAYESAQAGAFTVATLTNPMGHGHVAVVLAHDFGVDPSCPENRIPIQIAQAGAENFFDVTLERGFGRSPVVFFTRGA